MFSWRCEVLTPTGYRQIKDIEVGDLVVSLDSDGSRFIRPVTRKLHFKQNRITKVSLVDGSSFRATQSHRVLCQRGWVFVKDLKMGDQLIRPDSSIAIVALDLQNGNRSSIYTLRVNTHS